MTAFILFLKLFLLFFTMSFVVIAIWNLFEYQKGDSLWELMKYVARHALSWGMVLATGMMAIHWAYWALN